MLQPIHNSVFRIFAYAVGVLMIFIGTVLLSGLGSLERIPSRQRIIFGVAIILYGCYRIVSTIIKGKREIHLPL